MACVSGIQILVIRFFGRRIYSSTQFRDNLLDFGKRIYFKWLERNTAVGFFTIGQFAIKKKPNLIWPNQLTEINIFSQGELSYGKKSAHEKYSLQKWIITSEQSKQKKSVENFSLAIYENEPKKSNHKNENINVPEAWDAYRGQCRSGDNIKKW